LNLAAIARLAPFLMLVVVVVAIGVRVRNVVENEGRSEEAHATVLRYLAALGGSEADRGWSILSASMRDGSGSRDEYIELASSTDATLATNDVHLTYEDDGFYLFTVTLAREIEPGHAEALFDPRGPNSPIACRTGPDQFEIAVIIGFFSEFAGVSGSSCPSQTTSAG
jgi:hypothetical protein